ncbi:piggyBac transposable element-derived protein 4-like isoform X1 [Xyrauchen texanus]|uniref:piggyBac transposable element-derived protein 4-like isoform X1 n=2 Tax=Xyrauchen texanus TaxID=154827 RepID=UPI0022425933|nr:piggyBac transposable element-derived protein 4-like isoform X1 [Xyrauchen texanus]
MSHKTPKTEQLTDEEISELFNNLEEIISDSSSSESDGEELPPNLVVLESLQDEADFTDGGKETKISDEGEEVSPPCWRTTCNFTPPGPGVVFDNTKCGVQNPPATPTEVQCFKMFITEALVEVLVQETNRHALQLLKEASTASKGKLAKWVPTDIKEMYTFLVTVLLMGMVKKSSLRDYWSTEPMLQTPFFGTLFSQDRFLLLLRCLNFANSTKADVDDPLFVIRRIFTEITSSFRSVFVPYRDLSVDQSMMNWKGRLALRQPIPAKRNRFGVKFFAVRDVLTGYVLDIIIYTGSTTDIHHYARLGVSGSVVMTLLAPYLGKGHIVYVDNWHSSPTLFQELLSHGTGACGAVRADRRGMPAFTNNNMTKGQMEFQENGTQLAVKWCDKREVHVLTTVHASIMAVSQKVDYTTGEKKMMPFCVLEYNKKMGAVDKADIMKSFVKCARKTTKWYKKIFFYMLETAVLNSFIVYRQLAGKGMTSLEFRMNLMRGLLEEYSTPRNPPKGGRPASDSPLRLTARHFLSDIPQTELQGRSTRRACKVCISSKCRAKKRRSTRYMCVACNIALCATPCFEEYHTLKNY